MYIYIYATREMEVRVYAAAGRKRLSGRVVPLMRQGLSLSLQALCLTVFASPSDLPVMSAALAVVEFLVY